MKAKPLPSQELLLQCLEYDTTTGSLRWRCRPNHTFLKQDGRTPEHLANAWNAAWAGKPAFTSAAKNKYLRGTINGEMFYAHRVIYKMVYGIEPDDIDHDDGNRQNNRIGNLISKTRGGNMKNRCLSSNNTSGFHGVSYSNRHNLWQAVIHDKGKPVHLGWFKEKEQAIDARQVAEKQYGYHPNHGRS